MRKKRYTLAEIDKNYSYISHQDIIEYALSLKIVLLYNITDQSELTATILNNDINSPQLPEALAVDPFNLFPTLGSKTVESGCCVGFNLSSLVPNMRSFNFDEVFFDNSQSTTNIDFSKINFSNDVNYEDLYTSKLHCLKNTWLNRKKINPRYSERLDLARHLEALKERFMDFIFGPQKVGRRFLNFSDDIFAPNECDLSFKLSRFVPIYELLMLSRNGNYFDILSQTGCEFEYNINCVFSDLFVIEDDFVKLVEKNKIVSIERNHKCLRVGNLEFTYSSRDRIDVLLLVLECFKNVGDEWRTFNEIKHDCAKTDEESYFKGTHENFTRLFGSLSLVNKINKVTYRGSDVVVLFLDRKTENRVTKYRLKSEFQNIKVISIS